MALYARSDVRSIFVGATGHTHAREVVTDDKGSKTYAAEFKMECPSCERVLANDPQWSANPNRVPLTPDEEEQVEDEKSKGSIALNKASEALAQLLKQTVSGAK